MLRFPSFASLWEDCMIQNGAHERPPYATATADCYLTVHVALPHQSVELRHELEIYLGGPIMTVPLNKALKLELLLGGWACVEAFLSATLFYLKKQTKHSGKGECMQE